MGLAPIKPIIINSKALVSSTELTVGPCTNCQSIKKWKRRARTIAKAMVDSHGFVKQGGENFRPIADLVPNKKICGGNGERTVEEFTLEMAKATRQPCQTQ